MWNRPVPHTILNAVLDESKFQQFGNVPSAPETVFSFPVYILSLIMFFYFFGTIFGVLRTRYGVRPGITRKLFTMVFFTLGLVLPKILIPENTGWLAVGVCSVIVNLGLIFSLSPTLHKFALSYYPFMAVARDGEEKHTVGWLWTETLATAVIIFGSIVLMEDVRAFFLGSSTLVLLVPALASGFSDAAAEITGTIWGKRKYKVPGLAKGKVFYRSVEGSCAFFLTTVVISLAVYLASNHVMDSTSKCCLLVLPFTLTIAEALAPHAWDNPFLYSTGYLTILAVYHLTWPYRF